MMMTPWSILVLSSFVAPTFAQSNGMDMSMDVPMNLAIGNMLPYLHFTPGDTVWFPGWVPSSAGAMVGTCVGVALLAMLERWLAACLELAEWHWVERASILALEKSDSVSSLPSSSESSASSSSPSTRKSKWHRLPPFVPEFDITRGVLFSAQAFIKVLLMLAVMTFQLAFLVSIAIGSGVGETLFGRFSLSHYEH
ncbi:CTR copper uptake transporter [Lanmaoa asiatica]|nr:CTR copper uptake transporter [Lanmaoa asiatica]